MFKNEFDGIESTPLLRCSHCLSFTILCPKCRHMLVLTEHPDIGSIISCGNCQAKFGHCERNDLFYNIVN